MLNFFIHIEEDGNYSDILFIKNRMGALSYCIMIWVMILLRSPSGGKVAVHPLYRCGLM